MWTLGPEEGGEEELEQVGQKTGQVLIALAGSKGLTADQGAGGAEQASLGGLGKIGDALSKLAENDDFVLVLKEVDNPFAQILVLCQRVKLAEGLNCGQTGCHWLGNRNTSVDGSGSTFGGR